MFHISKQKHMLWVLIGKVSLRHFQNPMGITTTVFIEKEESYQMSQDT